MTSVEFIRPNLHVALVHFPIALLASGTAIEVFSFLGWRRSGFRTAGRWMILLGALLAPAVALSGIYAMRDAVAAPADHEQFASWREMLAHSRLATDESAWATMQRHLWLGVAAPAAAMLLVLSWLAVSDAWRRRLHIGFVSLLVATVTVTLIGAHAGGRLVYDHGVGVALPEVVTDTVSVAVPDAPVIPTAASTAPSEARLNNDATTQPQSPPTPPTESLQSVEPPAAPTPPTPPPTSPDVTQSPVDGDALLKHADKLAPFLPPMQTHLVVAGLSISLSLLAVALSIRRWSEIPPLELPGGSSTTRSQQRIAAAFSQPVDVDPDIDAPWPPGMALPTPTPVPASRFFLLACLLAILTAASGIWYLAIETREVKPGQLWEQIVAPYQNMDADGQPIVPTRRLAHVVTGGSLILLPLLLAIVARLAPRSRLLLLGLATLLLVMVVAQLWFGTLLLLDSNVGSITAFQGE